MPHSTSCCASQRPPRVSKQHHKVVLSPDRIGDEPAHPGGEGALQFPRREVFGGTCDFGDSGVIAEVLRLNPET